MNTGMVPFAEEAGMSQTSGSIHLYFSRVITLLIGLLVGASLPFASYAQSTQGSIIGTVKDTGGALVPDAPVTLTNLGEGTSRRTRSNAQGDYAFLDVKAGRYTVEISQPGFQ